MKTIQPARAADESTGWRRLAGAAILQAISDYTKDHNDLDALEFLQSRTVKGLLKLFGLDPGRVYKQLDQLPSSAHWGHKKGKANKRGRDQARHKRAQRLRAKGLNSHGEPLARSCYNCIHIRKHQVLNGWLACRKNKCKPSPAKAMTQHNGCEVWELRTQEI